LGEISLGEMGLGEMGLGEMGQNPITTMLNITIDRIETYLFVTLQLQAMVAS